MNKMRIAVLLLLMFVLAGWCTAQDDQVLVSDTVDITTTIPLDPAASTPAMAGNAYTTAVSATIVDNHKNCTVALGRNCWTKTTAGVITQESVGLDGFYLGIGANHVGVYHLPLGVNGTQQAWTSYPGLANVGSYGPVYALAVASQREVYGLGSGPGCPTNTGIYKANASLTAWTFVPGGCLQQLSAAPGGYLAGVASGNGWYSLNGGSTWIPLPSTWKKVVIVNRTRAYGINANGAVYSLELDGVSAALTSIGGAATTELTASPFDIWIRDTNGTWYQDMTSTASWVHMQGVYTQLVGSGTAVFGLTGTQPFHFNTHAPYVRVNTSGSYNCAAFSGGVCPSGSAHYLYAGISFSDGGLSGVARQSSTSACPGCFASTTVGDVDFACDLEYGVPSGSPQCKFQPSGKAICNVMGSIFSAAYTMVKYALKNVEYAYSRVINIQGTGNLVVDKEGIRYYSWAVSPYCSNIPSYSFPDYDPLGVDDSPLTPQPWGWDVEAACERPFPGSPWICQDTAIKPATRFNTAQPPKPDCTYNPY